MGLSSLGGGGGAACHPGLSRNFLSPLEAPAPPQPKSEAWTLATMRLGACGPGCSSSSRRHPVPSCSVHLLTSGNPSRQSFLSQPRAHSHTIAHFGAPSSLAWQEQILSHQQRQTWRLQGGALLTVKFCTNHAPHDHKQPRPPSAWEGKSQGPQ